MNEDRSGVQGDVRQSSPYTPLFPFGTRQQHLMLPDWGEEGRQCKGRVTVDAVAVVGSCRFDGGLRGGQSPFGAKGGGGNRGGPNND